ncbi:MAG: hypothetical protein R3Y23_00835 [Bacillota bacterium]
MKKIFYIAIMIILIASLSTTVAFGVYYSTDFSIAEDTTELANENVESELITDSTGSYQAEIAYNNILTGGGYMIRSLQFYVDSAALAAETGKSVSSTETEINAMLSSLAGTYSFLGYGVNLTNCFLDITVEIYSSYTDYYIAYGIDGYYNSESSYESKNYGFFVDTYVVGETIFANMYNNGLYDALLTMTAVTGLEETDVALIYNYGTKYSTNLITSDATNTYYYENYGCYIHKYVMDINSTDLQYTLIQHTPNTTLWYLVILLGGTALALGLFGFMIVYKRRKA